MEKLDAIVAIAGGVILAVAIVGAALSGAVGASAFDVSFKETTKASPPIPITISASGGSAKTSFALVDANVTSVKVKAFVNSTLFPTGASARVKLTAPDERSAERDGTTGMGAAVTFLGVEVELPVMAKPNATTVQASDAASALDMAAVANATAGVGNWTIELSWAPVGPVPPQSVSAVALPSWSVYSGSATPRIVSTK